MSFFRTFLYILGILGLLRSLPMLYRYIIGYIKPHVNVKKTFKTEWALVTGANSGTGRHLSLLLAKQKVNVIGVGRDLATLASLKKEIEDLGVECLTIQADLTKEEFITTYLKLLSNN